MVPRSGLLGLRRLGRGRLLLGREGMQALLCVNGWHRRTVLDEMLPAAGGDEAQEAESVLGAQGQGVFAEGGLDGDQCLERVAGARVDGGYGTLEVSGELLRVGSGLPGR